MIMKRENYAKKLKAKYISESEKTEYYKRLVTIYQKKGLSKCFIDQYLNGSGSELINKFWSKHSSSRFAFEMYSWIATDDKYNDIIFEYQLPTLNGYSVGAPNMDVFIEDDRRIILIESKLLESSKLSLDSLSDSYYLEDNVIKEDGKLSKVKGSLLHRYYGKETLANETVSFIKKIKELVKDKKNEKDFFDVKQEVNHIIGIALQLLHLPKGWQGKNIEFYNVVYQFDDDNNNKEIREGFINIAKEYIRKLYKNINFEYGIKTPSEMLDYLGMYENQIAFGCENVKVKERLEEFDKLFD